MIELLKLRIGTVLTGSYLCLFIALLIGIAISNDPVRSDAFLVAYAIVLPWSHLLVGTLFRNLWRGGSMPTFFFLMILCALVNATILYLFGLLVTKVSSFLTKK
jgi:hypothetical protein